MISTKQVDLSKHIKHLAKTYEHIKTKHKAHNTVFTWFTPLLGLRPPTLLLYILRSISYKHRAIKTLTLHRTEDLRSSLDPSSLRYNTKPSTVSHRDLHSALQVLHKMHKALITQIQLLALSLHHIDISSTTSLYGLDIYIYIQNRPKHG
jgi:hypothetical protein